MCVFVIGAWLWLLPSVPTWNSATGYTASSRAVKTNSRSWYNLCIQLTFASTNNGCSNEELRMLEYVGHGLATHMIINDTQREWARTMEIWLTLQPRRLEGSHAFSRCRLNMGKCLPDWERLTTSNDSERCLIALRLWLITMVLWPTQLGQIWGTPILPSLYTCTVPSCYDPRHVHGMESKNVDETAIEIQRVFILHEQRLPKSMYVVGSRFFMFLWFPVFFWVHETTVKWMFAACQIVAQMILDAELAPVAAQQISVVDGYPWNSAPQTVTPSIRDDYGWRFMYWPPGSTKHWWASGYGWGWNQTRIMYQPSAMR